MRVFPARLPEKFVHCALSCDNHDAALGEKLLSRQTRLALNPVFAFRLSAKFLTEIKNGILAVILGFQPLILKYFRSVPALFEHFRLHRFDIGSKTHECYRLARKKAPCSRNRNTRQQTDFFHFSPRFSNCLPHDYGHPKR